MDKILTKFRQTILLLDPNILLTKLGQNVDIFLSKFCQIYKNLGQSNSLQTNLGQLTKILDKILTKIRQNLVKLRLFWQLLDIDKTWTKLGQNLDKTWTFVKKLSKFCPNTHSIGAPTSAIRPLFGKVGGALASILPVIYELSSPFIPFTVLREDRGVVVNAIRPWHSAKNVPDAKILPLALRPLIL